MRWLIMFMQKYRLNKRQELKKIFQKGKKSQNKFFKIYFLENNLAHCRLAVITSLKISKKATKRNRLKRQVREIIRLKLGEFKHNYDLIVSVLPATIDQCFDLLKNELLTLLKKSKVL